MPDDKHERLRHIAKQRGISLNRLMDELSTVVLAEFDAYTRFKVCAARGSTEAGLELLDRLDQKKS